MAQEPSMFTLHNVLNTVHSTNAEVCRRGRNLIKLAFGMAVLTLASLPLVLGNKNASALVPMLLVTLLIFLSAIWLSRTGRVTLGSAMVIGVTVAILISITFIMVPNTNGFTAPFFLVLSVLLAGILLKPAHIWWVLLACLLGLGLTVVGAPVDRAIGEALLRNAISIALLLVMVAMMAFVSASSVYQALGEAQAARHESEAANQALQSANSSLEARVNARTADLAKTVAERQAAAEALQASLQTQQALNRVIADLAVPVIPVRHDTLVVPLVGNIDSARADQILNLVLTRVERDGARLVVLDVTGVAVVDTQVAAALLRVATATRLMGAQVTLAGIRPEVAQSLVGLGVDLHELQTVSTLQDALI